jgi:hypothetical protein
MSEAIGYVVCEVNQASGLVERLWTDDVHGVRMEAEMLAAAARRDAADRGRRESYFVAALFESGER